MVFLSLEYYCDLSFLLFLSRKGNILSSIPNSNVVLLSFIVLAKKIPKKTHAAISGTKSYEGITAENKTQGIVFNPNVGITNRVLEKLKWPQQCYQYSNRQNVGIPTVFSKRSRVRTDKSYVQ